MKKVLSIILSMAFVVISLTGVSMTNVSSASTAIKLSVDGYKTREVVSFDYQLEKPSDENGVLSDTPKIKSTKIKVKALNDGTPDLLDWMVQRDLSKNFKIIITDPKTGKTAKTIEFEKSYCVHFDETFEVKSDGTVENYEIITITSGKIIDGSASYVSPWF